MISTSAMMNSKSRDSDMSTITGSHVGELTHHFNNASGSCNNYQQPLLFEEPSLCGRSREKLLLLKSYHRLRSTHKKQVVTVHGPSGSGKTFLVTESLRTVVSENNGYFVSGKCEQVLRSPYAPLMAAFSDICDLVLQAPDAEHRIPRIQKAMGEDTGGLLLQAIGNLAPFLNNDCHSSDDGGRSCDSWGTSNTRTADNDAAMMQFTAACKNFLRAMSSKVHPIVLFLDDIQWIDGGSKQLLQAILKDSGIKDVMVILAHRDDEEEGQQPCAVEDNGPLLPPVVEGTTESNRIDISVKDLDADGVHELISLLMGSTSPEIRALSDLTMQKTCGNAFHVVQFAQVIHAEGLLSFDTRGGWTFDVDKIQRDLMVSDSLVDLLSLKISHLEPAVQSMLKIASLLGYRFEQEVICDVMAKERSDVNEDLEQPTAISQHQLSDILAKAVDEKFLEKVKGGFQFSHDKLLSAFQSMLGDAERARLHYIIGTKCHAGNDAKHVYHTALHLNSATGYFDTEEKRVELARINAKAFQFCKDKSAFIDAANCLRYGLALLENENKWTTHFDLAFGMTESLAKMELIIGNLAACKTRTSEGLTHCTSVEMSLNLLYVDVEVRMAGNEMEEAIETACKSLKQLGVHMPRRLTFVNILLKLRRVRKLIGGKTDDEILGLPLMQDRKGATAVRMLVQICLHCLLCDEDILAVYAALLAAELTLTKNGVTPHSATALVIYGIAEVSLGKIDQGFRFGELAIKLLNQIKCKAAECPTICLGLTSLVHWKTPYSEMRAPLMQALTSGFETGDVVYGSMTIANCCALRIMLGENLHSLEDFMHGTYRRMCDLSHKALIMWTQPSFQFVLNMQSTGIDRKDLTVLKGEIMNEDEYMIQATTAKNTILKMMLWTYKSLLAFNLGFNELAAQMYVNMEKKGKVYHDSYGAVPYYFYGAMIFYERYRVTGQRKHLKSVRKHIKGLKRHKGKGSPTAGCHLIFLEAEELSLRARPKDAAKVTEAYERAIDVMREEQFVHLEALGYERTSIVLAKLGCVAEARPYIDRSIDLCRDEWGAIAKSEWLQEVRCRIIETPEAEEEQRVVTKPTDVILVNSACPSPFDHY